MRRLILITLGVGGLVVLALIVCVIVAATNRSAQKAMVQAALSAATRHNVRMGAVQIQLHGGTTIVHADDVVVASPPDITKIDLVHAKALDAVIDTRALFLGRLVVTSLSFSGADLHLVRLGPDRNNYTLGAGGGAGAGLRTIQRLSAQKARFSYDDPERRFALKGSLNHDAALSDAALRLQGGGIASGQPFTFTATGAPLNGRTPGAPYPFTAHLVDDRAVLDFKGTTQKPFDFRGFDLDARAAGPNLADLHYLIIQLDPINSPPFTLATHAHAENRRVVLSGLKATFGGTDISGQVISDHRSTRRLITARLTAGTLRTDDVAALTAAPPDHATTRSAPGKSAAAGGGPIQSKAIPLTGMRSKDIDLSLSAGRVVGFGLEASNLMLHASLDRGRLTIAPVSLGLDDGAGTLNLTFDATSDTPKASIRGAIRHVGLEKLKGSPAATVGGKLDLWINAQGHGASPFDIARNATGRAAFVLSDGRIGQAQAEALGGDLAKSVTGALVAKGATVLQCAGGTFVIDHDRVQTDDIRILTDVGETDGRGDVDLGKDQLAFTLSPKPRAGDFSQVAAPIIITGSLQKPKASAGLSQALHKGGLGGAVKLALSPITGLIPNDNQKFAASCAALAAREAGAVSH